MYIRIDRQIKLLCTKINQSSYVLTVQHLIKTLLVYQESYCVFATHLEQTITANIFCVNI